MNFIDFSDFENSKLHLMLEAAEYIVLNNDFRMQNRGSLLFLMHYNISETR